LLLDEKTGSASGAENNSKDSSSKSSETSSTSGEQRRAPPPQSPGLGGAAAAAAGFPPSPFDFSAMTGLLNVCLSISIAFTNFYSSVLCFVFNFICGVKTLDKLSFWR
jgi:hypothetical protein